MVALLMESKPDSDMLWAGPTHVRVVPVLAGRLLEVLAPLRLEAAPTGVILSMLLSALARDFASSEKATGLSSSMLRCSIIER